MPFKKKKKPEEIAKKQDYNVEKKEEQKQTAEQEINLLETNSAIRDHVYNNRIINELTAIRAAIEELTQIVKDEQ